MPITVIDEIQPAGSGTFGIVRDEFFIGGFRVVADATARDAITSDRRLEGMRVALLSDGSEWVLRSDLTTWNPLDSTFKGDVRLLPSLAAATDILHLYVALPSDSPAGSNSNSGLDAAHPWNGSDLQFAFDQIPDGAVGTVVIHCFGLGVYDDIAVPRQTLVTPDFLNIVVMADTTDDGSQIVLPINSSQGHPLIDSGDPTGGTWQAVYQLTSDPFVSGIGKGTHWLQPTGIIPDLGTPPLGIGYGTLMRGEMTDREAGTFWCIQQFDPATVYTEFTARPLRTVIESTHATIRSSILKGQPGVLPINGQVTLTYVGFVLGPNYGMFVQDVVISACIAPVALTAQGTTASIYAHVIGEMVMVPTYPNIYFSQNYLDGYFEGGTVQLMTPAVVLGGVYTYRNGNGDTVIIGAHTSGGRGSGCTCEIDYVDADYSETSAGVPFTARHASVRFANGGGIALKNVSSLVRSLDRSFVSVLSSVFGKVAAPILVDEFSNLVLNNVFDPANGGHTAAHMANSATPDADVLIGATAAPYSYHDLIGGKNDLGEGTLSHFSRATLG